MSRGTWRSSCTSQRWFTPLSVCPQQQRSGGEALEGVTRLLEEYADIPQENRRCFGIVAHIDHGKSTLADQLLIKSGNIPATDKQTQQVLDNLKVERERGITVKAQTASMIWTNDEGEKYLLSLIDTPGALLGLLARRITVHSGFSLPACSRSPHHLPSTQGTLTSALK